MFPDAEPPRRIVFEVERPAFVSWAWRWLAPMAASAAVALAIVSMAPRPQQQVIERVVVQQPAATATPVAAQPIDYERIINELRDDIQKRDAAQRKEIQRVRGELAFVESQQWVARRNDAEIQASIQQIALKSDDRE
jgi:hypothetical protein